MTPPVIVEIGGIPVLLRGADCAFRETLVKRYAGFVTTRPSSKPFELTLRLESSCIAEMEKVRVMYSDSQWRLERGDFRAEWSPRTGAGEIRHAIASPHSVDSVLRILHSILLAPQGGFLLHAASAIRNGSAFAFSGISGAGKTTMARLAPPDATLLTDEISYVLPEGDRYRAVGTPFAGELGIPGENVSAPLKAIYLLSQGAANKCEPVPRKEAAAALLRNILFFAEDPELVATVFRTACRFVASVPIYRLTFVPTPEIWEMIG